MGQSLSQLYVHLIFRTKGGQPLLLGALRYQTHAYVQQEAYHQAKSFEEEYRRILKACEVEYDQRYVWD
ncbi:MAG TPA: hypothetical protein VMT20_23410 [Terriglobia bacterium]|nr:hypothetical protein [Terriglobia bacterium]